MAHYRKGLKDFIKDELARTAEPPNINTLIELLVQINNRLEERKLDQRAFSNTGQPGNRSNEKRKRTKGRYSRWPEPMELDATGRKPPSKEEMERRRRDKCCFECGLPGHIASSHRKNQGPKKQWKPRNKQINATGVRSVDQGRGGYDLTSQTKQLCASSARYRLTEEELEALHINTQIDDRYQDKEFAQEVEDVFDRTGISDEEDQPDWDGYDRGSQNDQDELS